MKFIEITSEQLEHDYSDDCATEYVVKTKSGELSLGSPSRGFRLGIYFQRLGGKGPVISFHEVVEIHQIVS